MLALTRAVSPSLAHCQLTHLARFPIDIPRAIEQHAAYETALRTLGIAVQRADPEPDLPDAVFVEDTAIILDQGAIITIPGAPSRRAETTSIAALLRHYGNLSTMQSGTLDGGDVLRLGKTLYVGKSSRTSNEGIAELQRLASPHGFQVHPLELQGCLHLKSAVTQVAENTLLLNPAWISPKNFPHQNIIEVSPEEPHAANALLLGDYVLYPTHFPRTRARLEFASIRIAPIPCDELAKAEGAVTCCSLIIPYA